MASVAKLGFIYIAVGLVCSVSGMLSTTGLLKLGIPILVMYAGFVLTMVGIFTLYLDLKNNESILREYEEQREAAEKSSSGSTVRDRKQ